MNNYYGGLRPNRPEDGPSLGQPASDFRLELLDVGGGSDPQVVAEAELVGDNVDLDASLHQCQVHRGHIAQRQLWVALQLLLLLRPELQEPVDDLHHLLPGGHEDAEAGGR